MIFYSYWICEQAKLDRFDTKSSKTGKEFTYTYYIELVKKFRDRTLDNTEYYDFEICQFKYDLNRRA